MVEESSTPARPSGWWTAGVVVTIIAGLVGAAALAFMLWIIEAFVETWGCYDACVDSWNIAPHLWFIAFTAGVLTVALVISVVRGSQKAVLLGTWLAAGVALTVFQAILGVVLEAIAPAHGNIFVGVAVSFALVPVGAWCGVLWAETIALQRDAKMTTAP